MNMKPSRSKQRTILIVCLVLIAVCAIANTWGNLTVRATHYTHKSARIPVAFDGYKIAQISDLHNAEFGQNNRQLIEILDAEKPDIICITGDLIDSTNTNTIIAGNFVRQAVQIAPCYYVTGNHEAWIGDQFKALEVALANAGVAILHDKVLNLPKENDTLQIIGLDDPDFLSDNASLSARPSLEKLKGMNLSNDFRLLLSHRPELFDSYASNGIDLTLSGHAHGGQFRLPFIGGIIAPNQGMLPEYDAGKYVESRSTMIVSRGIGNSVIPVRLNNRPEIVIVTLSR